VRVPDECKGRELSLEVLFASGPLAGDLRARRSVSPR
jgi:hypothetical protein